MLENFADLDIDGSFVREMRFVPSKTVRMSLLRAPQTESETQVTRQYDLQFHGVYGFRSNLDAQPWLETKSHDLLSQSDYLREVSEQINATSPHIQSELRHFKIICDEGEIDVIAERFTSSITDEIAHAGSFASRQAEQTNAQTQHEDNLAPAPELNCAFCGKGGSEVAKIVTGPSASICDACVTICSDLITKPV